jgi:hypothetical protein
MPLVNETLPSLPSMAEVAALRAEFRQVSATR